LDSGVLISFYLSVFQMSIRKEKEESDEQTSCRLCLEKEGGQLIAPCLCSGSSRFIHRECLDKWRATQLTDAAFTHCGVCKFKYSIDSVDKADSPSEIERVKRYRRAMARDVIQGIGCVLGVIGALSLCVWITDKNNGSTLIQYCCGPRGCQSSVSHAIRYYIIGCIIFLAVIGVWGMFLWMQELCAVVPDPPHHHRQEFRNVDNEWRSMRSDWSPDINIWVGRPHAVCASPTPSSSSSSSSGDCSCAGGGGGGGGRGSGNSKDECAGVLLMVAIVVFVFAVVGLFVGIGYAIQWARQRADAHSKTIWNLEEVQKYPVHDFQNEPSPKPFETC
jgi:RING-variant domain